MTIHTLKQSGQLHFKTICTSKKAENLALDLQFSTDTSEKSS